MLQGLARWPVGRLSKKIRQHSFIELAQLATGKLANPDIATCHEPLATFLR
jgi:hypothetical protein